MCPENRGQPKRLDPTFDVTEHGFTTFSGMLKGMEALVEVRKGENDQQLRLRGLAADWSPSAGANGK